MIRRVIKITVLLLFLFINSINVAGQEISGLLESYQKCHISDSCQKLEKKLITEILKSTDMLTVLEKLPDLNDINYQIIRGNLSGSQEDYIIKVVYERLGYIAIFIRDTKINKYKTLPHLNVGYINKILLQDIVGDGSEELVLNGYGTGTGYSSSWIAVYKYKDFKMNLIWSGDKETEYYDEDGLLVKENYKINFVQVNEKKRKEIRQEGKLRRFDANQNNVISEREIKKGFVWSKDNFKYIEKKMRDRLD